MLARAVALRGPLRGHLRVTENMSSTSSLMNRRSVLIAQRKFLYSGLLASGAAAIVLIGALGLTRAFDRNALWNIVHDQCVPNQQQHADPAPCARVDLQGGIERGYVILKDIVGHTQYLLIATARISGIESPELLQPGAPNYFAAAWRERGFTERAAGHPLPRVAISLAINSANRRGQDQFHIHIDCVRADVQSALRAQLPRIGDAHSNSWAPFPEPLAGHDYRAIRVLGAELDVDPFVLVADGVPGASAAMGPQTLVVVGADFGDAGPGFVILNASSDSAGAPVRGEELQDHACALARE
jgi:CDP-diacylglycerol pyrophosphatase